MSFFPKGFCINRSKVDEIALFFSLRLHILAMCFLLLYAASALAGLTDLVYWVGYRAQGSTLNKKKLVSGRDQN